ETDAPGGALGPEEAGDRGLDSWGLRLDLDVQPEGREGAEHLPEGGDADALRPEGKALPTVGREVESGVEALELRERVLGDPAVAVGAALEGRIVRDDELAVAGGMDVELEHVGAPALDRPLEGREGVLGGEQRAASVGDVQRGAEPFEERVAHGRAVSLFRGRPLRPSEGAGHGPGDAVSAPAGRSVAARG